MNPEALGELFGQLLGPITGLVSQITSLASQITQFVGAFSPATVMMFQDALQNIYATVGIALAPALQVLTNTLLQMSGVLDSLMRELQPIFTQLAQIVGTVLLTELRLVASVLSLLAPVIQVVADVLTAFYEVVKSVIDVFTVFVRALQATIGSVDSGFKNVLDQIVKEFRLLISYMVQFTAAVAKLVGLDTFVDNLAKQFERLAAETEAASVAMNRAARNSQVDSLEGIMRKFTASAFIASGDKTDPADEARKEQVKWLREIAENTKAISGKNRTAEAVKAVKDAAGFGDKETYTSFWDRSMRRAGAGAVTGSVIPFVGPAAGAAGAVLAGGISDIFS